MTEDELTDDEIDTWLRAVGLLPAEDEPEEPTSWIPPPPSRGGI